MMKAGTIVWPTLLRALWTETDGQDLIEYSLLLGFIAITAIAFLDAFRTNTTGILSKAGSSISSATTAAS